MGTEPHDIDLSVNPEWTSDTFRFVTQSLASPVALFEEHVATGERTLLRRIPTPNVDLDTYRSTRLWAPSIDGVRVPIDVVHHVDTPLDGTAPGVLYGYGSYEVSLPPWFSVARLSLLDRGYVWALALSVCAMFAMNPWRIGTPPTLATASLGGVALQSVGLIS